MNIKLKNTENDQVGMRADLTQDRVICNNGEVDEDIDTKFDYVKDSFADPRGNFVYVIQKCRNDVNTVRAKYTRYEAEQFYLHALHEAIDDMNVKFKGE